MKNKRKKQLFITIAIILILITVFCLIHFLNRTKMNSGYVNGNSAGNLYNGGLFCESNGTVFFSNPSDNHRLYSMNPDGSDMKKLSDDNVSYINADDHYVYYIRNNKSKDTNFSFLNFGTNSLCRINRDGGRVTILDDDPSLYAGLYGNYIYYIHYDKETASTLYRVKIDGTKKEQVSKFPYKTCSSNGQYMYFNGENDSHSLLQLDTADNSVATLYSCTCYEPTVINDTAYYMDGDNDYGLSAYSLSSGTANLIIPSRIDCYNVTGDYIYYQKNGEGAGIYRCLTDGSNEELLISGNYTALHTTSQYLYFYKYGNDSACYQMPLSGTGNDIGVFTPEKL